MDRDVPALRICCFSFGSVDDFIFHSAGRRDVFRTFIHLSFASHLDVVAAEFARLKGRPWGAFVVQIADAALVQIEMR